MMRNVSRTALAILLASTLGFAALPTVALADEPGAAPAHAGPPGDPVSLGAAVAIGVVVLLSVAGIGCASAVLGTLFPRLSAAMDRQARGGSTAASYLYGSLVLVGVLAATAGAAQGHPRLGGVVAVALGLPALLLLLSGALATLPLLGERLLGARGASASPLFRSITGSLALGLAFLPGVALHLYPIAFLVGLAATGWPLGVGIAALLARARPPTGSPAKPPPPPATT